MADNTFITATEARFIARNNTLIWTEISEVQTQILAAIDANTFSIIVDDGTPMTSTQSILSVAVTAGGTGFNSLVATAVINDGGTGGAGALVTPVVTGTTITGFTVDAGGSGYTPVDVTATIADPSDIKDGQDETNYDGVGGDGTFNGGADYAVSDIITLSESSVVTVDAVTTVGVITIAGQDETDFDGAGNNGTFVGGDGLGSTEYAVNDTITLNDGSLITVDAIAGNGNVTQFTITSSSTARFVSLATLTQIGSSSSGSGFTLTTGTNNETTVGAVTDFTIASPGATPFFFPATLLQSTTTGIGTGFSVTPAVNNINALVGGTGALLTPIETSGNITNVVINVPGTGFLVGAPIIFTHPNGVDAAAQISAVGSGGEITAITITNPGSGFEQAVATVTVTAPGGAIPALEFVGTVTTTGGVVTGISIQEGGSGYAPVGPLATITDPTGANAVLAVTEVAGVITAIAVITGGSGYTAPVVVIDDNGTGGTGATATATAGINTFGTSPSDFNDVLTNQTTDAVILDQITFVSDYFTSLGYNIRAQTNSATTNTMQWQIIW